jgi:hypothetical protein
MESIHPNDIITLDMNQISYVTLKNGDMILIDESVPEKTNKNKKIISSDKNESIISKKHKLEISPLSILSFKGKRNEKNNKSDFNLYNKIVNNINFSFKGIESNKIGKFSENDKENKTINSTENTKNYNSSNFIKGNRQNNYDQYLNLNKNIFKENEFPQNKNLQSNNNNNENNINFSKIENTNASIPMINFSNTLDNKNNFDNNQTNRRKSRTSRASRLFGTGGGLAGIKGRISINAVCSLNIRGEDKYNINLIRQFNSLVDKLNDERDKKALTESNRDNKSLKYYELYKDKSNNMIKKNIETLNHDYRLDIKDNYNKSFFNNTLNNFNSNNKKTFKGFSNDNSVNGFKRHNLLTSPTNISSNGIKMFKNKINKYSSKLVLPSNKIIHF